MYLSRESSDASRPSTRTSDDSSSTTTTTASSSTSPKEPVVSQRVTRSSQRNAQQNGDNSDSKNCNGINHGAENDGDEINSAAGQSDRIITSDQSSRKAKRKRLEQQAEVEQDGQLQGQQSTYVPEFCPDDYQLPESNSIELYRGLVRARHRDIMRMTSAQPKAPSGIRDYLLLNGPYLLEGDKLGIGQSGASVGRSSIGHSHCTQQLPRLKMKLSRTRSGAFRLLASPQHQLAATQRLNTYNVPQLLQAPESLRANSPLFELFQSQEKARHKMRMQHLKERERSILTSEQEILRAYNRESSLSACNYLHHQEKYHYMQEKEGQNENLDYPPMATSRDHLFPMPSSQQEDTDEAAKDTSETSAEQKVIEKLINDLQELDEKWAKIKRDMFVRHKNESDTLHAIQALEWEWRAKETGARDKEYVPRVEVSALEY